MPRQVETLADVKAAAAARDKAANKRAKELESALAAAVKQLEDLRRSRFSLPSGGRKRASRKGSTFCRVVIPDSHGCHIDGPASRAFLDDLEQIKPAEVVWLGDHLDCGGFLAMHHTMGYIAETEYTFEDDCNAANQFLDAVQARCPGAEHHFLYGNHERRIEAWIVDQTVRNSRDAAFLSRVFSVESVLALVKRGFKQYLQGRTYSGLSVPAVLKLGKCCFTHGTFTTKNAAKSHLDEYVSNIVFGHTHRADSYTRRTLTDTYSAWNPGCLCKQQNYWQHSRNTHHVHGYGLQAVDGEDGFLHISVPIIDGQSYLKPLASQLAG